MQLWGEVILLYKYWGHIKHLRQPISQSLLGGSFGLRRRQYQRGGALIIAMMLTTVMLLLGAAHLISLQSERRFSGIQERNLQAWYLAKSGCDYFFYYCQDGSTSFLAEAPGNKLSAEQESSSGASVLAKVPVVDGLEHYYFEISRLSAKVIRIRGVVEGTLSSSGEPTCLETSLYIVRDSAGGWKNAIYEQRPDL